MIERADGEDDELINRAIESASREFPRAGKLHFRMSTTGKVEWNEDGSRAVVMLHYDEWNNWTYNYYRNSDFLRKASRTPNCEDEDRAANDELMSKRWQVKCNLEIETLFEKAGDT